MLEVIMDADKTVIVTYKSIPHTHSYGADWKSDADNHWHECPCGDRKDIAAHSFKWVIDKEPTATRKGSKHEECTVCGYKKAAVAIPAKGSTVKPTSPEILPRQIPVTAAIPFCGAHFCSSAAVLLSAQRL